jgi:vacuolar-type H+-ATPase subunit H
MAVMPTDASLPSNRAVDAAIARVLEAEQAARDAVLAAEREAEQLTEEARGRARAIGERCERRIRSVLAVHDAHAAAHIAALDAEAATLGRPHALDADEVAEVRRAVLALAAELTGDRR